MRMASRLAPLCLGVLTLVAAARSANAQTYVWTDERGVVHAAAEPSEVPEKFRAKAVKDAERPRSNVTVLPPPDPPAAPETDDPTAPAPMLPGHKPAHAAPPKPETPAADAPKTVEPGEAAAAKKGLPEPAPGFEWSCTADPDGGKPKCEQFEKRSSKRARHAAARDAARKQLGVDPDAENDPEVQEQLQQRADKEYEKTTRKPPVPDAHPADDEDSDDPED